MEITQARVCELFDYLEDGTLIAKKRAGPRLAGAKVGCERPDGYMNVCIDGKYYLVHRIIFLWHHGYLPDEVDHKDLNTRNNKIENLRAATQSQNRANRNRYASNRSGKKGVCWHRRRGKWHAQVKHDGKVISLGFFDNLDDAAAAYEAAASKLHGEFARAS